MRKWANSVFVISKKKLEACQLPDEVQNRFAFKIKKPSEWL